MIIIGLHAPARSGKTTVANYLNSLYDFQEIAFADRVKDAIAALLGMSRSEADKTIFSDSMKDAPLPLINISPRQMMQTLGTDWGRNMISNDLWIRLANDRITNIAHTVGNIIPGIVISDVRYPNEAAYVRQRGFLIHIHRDNAEPVRQHTSENGIESLPTDIHIDNNGDLQQLKSQIDALVAHFMYRQKGIA